jgi:hypothetical protein
MKTLLIIIILCATVLGQKTLSYKLSKKEHDRLSSAIIGFRPIPLKNIGTEKDPVLVDSCSHDQWVDYIVEEYFNNLVYRWEQKCKIDSIKIKTEKWKDTPDK